MAQLTGSAARFPARASFLWYFALILAGSTLLVQPVCHGVKSEPIRWLDAIFTATSAACVTGLSVRSTEHDFSFVGQIVILGLIQLGGIGIMTVTTFIMLQFGQRHGLRTRAVITQTLGAEGNADLGWILRRVFALTFICEGMGCVILTLRHLVTDPLPEALWRALFHSVSAFCNAGFALDDESLVPFRDDVVVNLTICGLIIIGGVGFPVIFDVVRSRRFARGERWQHLTLHTKLMLIGSTLLIGVGMASFLILEWDGVLEGMTAGEQLLVAFFYSVSCRTAGFNTVDLAALTNATLFMTVLFMAIGAGPCSTGGGFKVSTFMILMLHAIAMFRGKRRLNVFRRTVPQNAIDRATATAMLFTVVASVALVLLLIIEQSGTPHTETEDTFLDALVEVVSALGTVGLSTGITAQLSGSGKSVIILLMFLGRLGPISAFLALSLRERNSEVLHPDSEPLIG